MLQNLFGKPYAFVTTSWNCCLIFLKKTLFYNLYNHANISKDFLQFLLYTEFSFLLLVSLIMLDTWHLRESKRNNSSLFWWIQKLFILVLLKIWNINAITIWINYNRKNYRNVEELFKGITAIKNQLRCLMFSMDWPVVATFVIWILSKFFNLHIEFLNHHITFIITVLCYHTKLEFNIFPLRVTIISKYPHENMC